MTDTQAPERIWVSFQANDPHYGEAAVDDNGNTEYVRADLARPRVKPLEWAEVSCGFDAVMPFGRYELRHFGSPKRWRCFGEYFGSPLVFDDLDDAKTAVESYHARRILSALEG